LPRNLTSNSYFGRNIYKNAFLLLKSYKNSPTLAPRPPASCGQLTTPLRIPGYATGLRPHELEGREWGRANIFQTRRGGSLFRDFVRTSFM